MSIAFPLSTVLQWREIAARPTASLISSGVAPYALATSVWKYTQYEQGTCADTAKPMSCLTLGLNDVFSLTCTFLKDAQAPDTPASGKARKKPGTTPSVACMSR
jgi:hypothetical protein